MTDVVERLAFHPGELAAQREAGLTEQAAHVQPIIAGTVPRGASEFLRRQRLLVLGAQDHDGRLWATALHGPEGFLSAADPHTLRTTAPVPPTDPLADVLRDQTDVGTLAIDLATRRRFRINGRWRPVDGGAEVEVHQAFGNCPKYINSRVLTDSPPSSRLLTTRGHELTAAAADLVAAADTFFIATAAAGGADVSHRGGDPGFVTVLSPTELSWPDYVGNGMLMTVGNLRLNPAAGLLFPDWRTGATLQVTGTAEVRMSTAVFRITGAVWTENAFPAGWSEPVYSRFNP